MLMLPIESKDHKHDALIVVLEKSNLERMRQADPVEIELNKQDHRLVNPTILICYEEDKAELIKVIHKGDLKGTLNYLQRGFEFRPDKGDHDRGPESIKEMG